MLGAIVTLAFAAGGAALLLRPRSDYARVEELRAEQDVRGTHDEQVRQRFFRLYTEHPKSAMYAYLWARCVDDAPKQLDIAQQGIRADPSFSWNYNIAARALAVLNRVPEAYEAAAKGAALDPANLQVTDKRDVLKRMIDHKLLDQHKPAPNGYTAYDGKERVERAAARYRGLFRGLIRSPERPDLQGIERSRLPDHKGPLADAVRGFVVCANTYADACLRVYVPIDARFGNTWPPSEVDPRAIKDNQVLGVAGAVVLNGRGENIMIADALTVEGT
jgi:hypothetical protein